MPRATVVDMTSRRPFRAASIVIAAMLAVGALAGCGPTAPTPTPTPTGFASEEEAFAAAEATYRAYVDALNQVDLSDPSTFEEVYRWTTGDANAEARESFSQMYADGWTVSGISEVALAQALGADDSTDTVVVAVCLDVGAVDVLDASGESVVSPSRGSIQTMTVLAAESASSDTGFLISSIEGREGEPACEN